jgi:glucose/arabinose dehydrogenase
MNRAALAMLLLLALSGCSRTTSQSTQSANETPPASAPSAAAPSTEPASFVNRVWKVAESAQVEPGQLYVFLSESTLVMTSPHGTPAFGKWSYDGTNLRMIEEGISYDVDIVTLTGSEFRIRSHNPGGAVEMRLVPAEESGPARIAP